MPSRFLHLPTQWPWRRAEVGAPAARITLNAVTANASQAVLAVNLPDGACAGAVLELGDGLLDDGMVAVQLLGLHGGQGGVSDEGVVPPRS